MKRLAVALLLVGLGLNRARMSRNYGPELRESFKAVVPERIEDGPVRSLDSVWFQVTIEKESSGDPNAIGAAGELGPFQVGRLYWIDGCLGAGVDLDYETNVRDVEACKVVIRGYWKKYGGDTWEKRSRLHNGGPSMAGTDNYWLDIRERMRKKGAKI